MREILFKAKRIDNGEWVEGNLFQMQGKYYICQYPYQCMKGYSSKDGEEYGFGGFESVDESTICQYTGLTDKNGRKIWENDIVKYHFGDDVAPIRFGKYQSCFDSVNTGHVGFYVDWDSKKAIRKDLDYWVNMIDCNVIGNVFDNPELLGMAAEPKNVEIVENTKCETDFEENETVLVENEADLEEITTKNEPEAAEILNAESDSKATNVEAFEEKCHEAWLVVQDGDYQNALEYLEAAKTYVKKMQEEAERLQEER